MFRLLSVLILLAGLAAAAFGGYKIYEGQGTTVDTVQSAPSAPISAAPPPASEVIEPAEEQDFSKSANRSASSSLPEAVLETADDLLTEPEGIGAPEPNFSFSTSSMREPALTQQLREVPVAYEVPEEAIFGRSFTVTFSLDGTGTGDATARLPNEERIIENQAEVGDRARAALLGSAFDIDALSPDTQIVSESVQNVWRWRAIPREAGQHELSIELFAIEDGDALPVRTLSDVVVVEVSRVNQVIAIANEANPIVVVLGGIGSALAGLFGVARFFRSGA